jgi:hypothetical protein
MKKICILIGSMVVSVFLLGASVWEGIARIVPGDELSEKGYTMATNSFPPNTVVEVTNLENGKTIQVVVTSGLESPGFLAAFSRNIALAMGARGQSLVKIRMTKTTDTESVSRRTEEVLSPEMETASAEAVTPESSLTQPGTQATDTPEPWGTTARAGIWNDDRPDTIVTPPRPENGSVQSPAAIPPQDGVDPATRSRYDLALIPAEERPPVDISGSWILPPEAEIAPLDPLPSAESLPKSTIDPFLMIPSTENRSPMVSPVQGMALQEYSEWPAFSVPVITSLEQGKYYLQLGAFGVIELIEAELSRIGKNYPLVIQPGGNPQTPIYRILLGPVTLGVSGTLLYQFKSLGYKDAFIRQGAVKNSSEE